ncbi:MAG: TPM domain-containing protein [Candidatus Woesearchaeota archaeon]|nr:TPM domain-containing protein [Candidatus Woesearchaeota archaeon]
MKKILMVIVFILITITFVLAQEISIKGFVNDYSNILSEQEKQQITQIAQSIYDSGKAEYAIVIINSTQGQDIKSYAITLAQGKLGSKEKDNGLLLLVSIEDREYRFEVGSGLEGTLNDAKVGRIGRDYLVPNFQKGQYGQGIIEASQAIQNALNQTANEQVNTNPSQQMITPLIVLIIFIIIFLSFFMFSIIKYSKKKNKHFKTARNALIFFGATQGFKGRGGFGGSGGGFGGGGFSGGGSSGGW